MSPEYFQDLANFKSDFLERTGAYYVRHDLEAFRAKSTNSIVVETLRHYPIHDINREAELSVLRIDRFVEYLILLEMAVASGCTTLGGHSSEEQAVVADLDTEPFRGHWSKLAAAPILSTLLARCRGLMRGHRGFGTTGSACSRFLDLWSSISLDKPLTELITLARFGAVGDTQLEQVLLEIRNSREPERAAGLGGHDYAEGASGAARRLFAYLIGLEELKRNARSSNWREALSMLHRPWFPGDGEGVTRVIEALLDGAESGVTPTDEPLVQVHAQYRDRLERLSRELESGDDFTEAVTVRGGPRAGSRTMTKSELATHIAAKFEVSKKTGTAILEELARLAARQAKNGFVFPGVGKLEVVNRKARMGRNPQTGEAVKIPARRVLKFRVAKSMRDVLDMESDVEG